MPNLLLGLSKNSIQLKPYSTFFHEQLGYEIFSLELKFTLSSKDRIQPDAILYSLKQGNTLVMEWTEAKEVTQRKHNQNNHYASVTSADLANFAAVPTSATRSFDIVLVVRPEATTSFFEDISKNNQHFPILELSDDGETILIQKKYNHFSIEPTDTFFSEGLRIDHNHQPRYIPFSLETNQPRDLAPFVVQHLVSLLIKNVDLVSLQDFCQGMISPWEIIGIEKQSELSKLIKALINDVSHKKWGSQILHPHREKVPTWELYPIVFKKNQRYFKKMLSAFIAEVREDTFQLAFEFD